MKKIISAVMLSGLAVTLALTGCSGLTNLLGGKDGKDVTLIWYEKGRQPEDLPLILEQVNPILNEQMGITLDMRFIPDEEYEERMNYIIDSGEAYDICFTSNQSGSYARNARNGAYLELNSYLKGEHKLLSETVDRRFWKGATVDGKIYGVPANKELSYAPAWVFSESLVDKYSFDMTAVNDLASLEPMLKTIYETEPGIVPLSLSDGEIPGITDMYDTPAAYQIPAYIRFDDQTQTVVNPFEQEDVIAGLRTIHSYVKKGYVSFNTPDPKNRLIYCAQYFPGAEEVWRNKDGSKILCVPRCENYYTTADCTSSLQAVSAQSKHKDKAVEFLELLNTDSQVKNLLSYGIEGLHYAKTADTSIRLIDAAPRYTVDYNRLGNKFIMFTIDPQPHDLWEQYINFNYTVKPSAVIGFNFNDEKVKNECTAVMNITAQYLPQLFSGSTADVDTSIAEMNQKLYDAGLSKIIIEMQKQVDTWNVGK